MQKLFGFVMHLLRSTCPLLIEPKGPSYQKNPTSEHPKLSLKPACSLSSREGTNTTAFGIAGPCHLLPQPVTGPVLLPC